MKSFFAVDLGASSGRTILGSFSPEGLKMEVVNRFPNHLIQVGKHYHWDIYELYRNILDGLTKAAASGADIESIGIDTWGCDFVCVGRDGGFLRQPYAYRDPHTVGAPEEFFKRIPREEVYGLTGIQVMDFNSLFQMDTLRRARDSAFENAAKLMFIPDALSYMLTGEMVTEYTVATTAQIVNARTRKLEGSLLAALGLTEGNFGRFVYPGTLVGTLTPQIQKITGLGPVKVIAVAGHDTGSAVAAVPAENENFAFLSSGTWSLMGVEVKEPVISDEMARLNFTNEGGVEGTIRVLKNICGMWLLERCKASWGNVTYDQLIQEALASEPGRSIINPDDPSFANPDDMEKAIRQYCRSRDMNVPETRGQMVRCIYESLALRYAQVLDNLRHLSGRDIDVLHIIGGGSQNGLLNQWTADAVGIPVVAGPVEATAIGNVMVQAVSAGVASDVENMRGVLRRSMTLKKYIPKQH